MEDRRRFWWDLVKRLSARDAEFRERFLQDLHQEFPSSSARIADLHNSDSDSRRFFLLNRDELRTLAAEGMAIGAHTIHHPLLSQCSNACAQAEIAGSKQQLQSALGQEIWALAYPFGDAGSITDRELALAKSAHFRCAFMNMIGT